MDLIAAGDHVLIEGPAGCGKTELIQYLAYQTNTPILRQNLNQFTEVLDFTGGLTYTSNNRFDLKETPFIQAYTKGLWLLLD